MKTASILIIARCGRRKWSLSTPVVSARLPNVGVCNPFLINRRSFHSALTQRLNHRWADTVVGSGRLQCEQPHTDVGIRSSSFLPTVYHPTLPLGPNSRASDFPSDPPNGAGDPGESLIRIPEPPPWMLDVVAAGRVGETSSGCPTDALASLDAARSANHRRDARTRS